MKKRMVDYLLYMDNILKNIDEISRENCQEIMDNHLIQINFFMHERLIHLIVTVLFAIGTFMTIFTYLMVENIGLLVLGFLLIILLVPYVKHYYLLENGVQKMYSQYDDLREKIKTNELGKK